MAHVRGAGARRPLLERLRPGGGGHAPASIGAGRLPDAQGDALLRLSDHRRDRRAALHGLDAEGDTADGHLRISCRAGGNLILGSA